MWVCTCVCAPDWRLNNLVGASSVPVPAVCQLEMQPAAAQPGLADAVMQQPSHINRLQPTSRSVLQDMRDIPTAFRQLLTEEGERMYCGVASGDNMRRAQVRD